MPLPARTQAGQALFRLPWSWAPFGISRPPSKKQSREQERESGSSQKFNQEFWLGDPWRERLPQKENEGADWRSLGLPEPLTRPNSEAKVDPSQGAGAWL